MISTEDNSNKTTFGDAISYRKEQDKAKRNLTINIGILSIIVMFLVSLTRYTYKPVMIEHAYTKTEYYAEVGSLIFSLLFIISLCSTFFFLGRYTNVRT